MNVEFDVLRILLGLCFRRLLGRFVPNCNELAWPELALHGALRERVVAVRNMGEGEGEGGEVLLGLDFEYEHLASLVEEADARLEDESAERPRVMWWTCCTRGGCRWSARASMLWADRCVGRATAVPNELMTAVFPLSGRLVLRHGLT